MTNVTYLLKISNSGTLKFMKACQVIRFLGIFCLGIGFLGKILSGLGFALAAHPYLPLLGSASPPRAINLSINVFIKVHSLSSGKFAATPRLKIRPIAIFAFCSLNYSLAARLQDNSRPKSSTKVETEKITAVYCLWMVDNKWGSE